MTAGGANSNPCSSGTPNPRARWWGLPPPTSTSGKRTKRSPPSGRPPTLDPGNWIIHKQIWAIEHPEQFYPAINPQWQRERLQEEGEN